MNPFNACQGCSQRCKVTWIIEANLVCIYESNMVTKLVVSVSKTAYSIILCAYNYSCELKCVFCQNRWIYCHFIFYQGNYAISSVLSCLWFHVANISQRRSVFIQLLNYFCNNVVLFVNTKCIDRTCCPFRAVYTKTYQFSLNTVVMSIGFTELYNVTRSLLMPTYMFSV